MIKLILLLMILTILSLSPVLSHTHSLSYLPCFNKLTLSSVQGKYSKFKKYPAHSAHVTSVRWSQSDTKLISIGGADTAVMVWNRVGLSENRTNATGDSDDSDTDEEEEGRGKDEDVKDIQFDCINKYA